MSETKQLAIIAVLGASMVVLTVADSRRAGVDMRGLAFDVPVATANGPALAAETRLDQVAVGLIVMRNVRALVAKPTRSSRVCLA